MRIRSFLPGQGSSGSISARIPAAPFLLLLGACTARPPVAEQRPFVVQSPHGDRVDEYYWLRDDDSEKKRPEIMRYLEAEKAYSEAMTAPLMPLRETLVAEIRSRIKEDDATVPAFDRGAWYWTKFEQGAEYPKIYRQKGGAAGPDPNAPAEVLLDGPALAKGEDYFAIGDYSVSDDGRYLAWTQDVSGRRIHTLFIKDLATGELLPERITPTLESVEWAADSRTLFYMRQDPVLLQSGPVYRHAVGSDPAKDALVFDEADKTLFVGIGTSASDEYLMISIEGFETNELRAVPRAQPGAPVRVVLPRVDGVRNYADHLKGRWVIRTNEAARNFRLVSVEDARAADRSAWREIVPHRTDAAIDAMTLLDGGIALQERVAANAQVRVLPWESAGKSGGAGFVVPTTEEAFAMTLGNNGDASLPFVRVVYTSPTTPRTTIDVDVATGVQAVRKVQPVPGYDASMYASARLWAPSRDGKRIPISIVWRKDAYAKDGTRPLVVDGYGAYGITSDAEFSNGDVSLLDRGFAVATLHVRGGADLGQDWYEDGRLMKKQNSFNDFIDATDYLVRESYGAKDKVFARGGSAGGLLMGAVANQAGDRYRGMLLAVPFVDALTTMLDETIPLTTNEWTQWGDPREKAAYDYIRSYSPYDNIEAKPYPAMLVTTGLWDSQVQYFEPAKYVARLRRLKTDSNPLIFHINLEAGHGGQSGRFERLKEAALAHAFFLDLAGLAR
jgi:oligopeptidase B